MKKIIDFFILVDTYARFQLQSEVSRFYLGYLWWIIEPILYVCVFYFVFQYALDRGGQGFIVFLFCGKIFFLWLAKTVGDGSNSIYINRNISSRTRISKALFPFVSIQTSNYKQIFPFLILLFIPIIFGYNPSPIWLMILPITFTLMSLIVALTLTSALLCTLIPDLSRLVPIALIFLMLSSGLFWDINSIENESLRDTIFICNPLAFIVDATRKVLMHKSFFDISHMTGIFAGSILTSAVIWKGIIQFDAYIVAREQD